MTGGEVRATMNGDLVYWTGQTLWYCRASDHMVVLRRGVLGS